MKKLMFIGLAVYLAGCARSQPIDYQSPDSQLPDVSNARTQELPKPKAEVEIKDDQFEPMIAFYGARQEKPYNPGSTYAFFLRSWIDKKTGWTGHQLYFSDTYILKEWKHWRKAKDDSTNMLNVVDIASKVISCSGYGLCAYSEHIGIDIPSETILSKKESGFKIKVSAQNGSEQIITVSAEMIKAQLDAMVGKLPAVQEPPKDSAQDVRPKTKRSLKKG